MKEKKQKRSGKIEIRWGAVLLFLLLPLAGGHLLTVATLLAALLHELGHLGMAWLLGVPVERITLYPFGADIRLGSSLRSYGKDMAVAAAGASVNWMAAWFGIGLAAPFGPTFASVNRVLAAVNLLPVIGLDGGVLCYSLLCLLTEEGRAHAVTRTLSFLTLFFLWLAAVYLLLMTDGDPSLLFLVCMLFASVFLRGGRREDDEENGRKQKHMGEFR